MAARAEASPWCACAAGGSCCGTVAAIGHGPVAGIVIAAYAGLAVLVLLRRRAFRADRRALVAALDGIAGVAGDVRAGVNPAASLGAAMPMLIGASRGGDSATVADLDGWLDATPRGQVLARFVAACRLAEQTGAPLADVLERLDGEVRSAERVRASASAHAATAHATAVLLAALPLAGVGLGHAIGTDPLAVLLHTPVGAACALAAVALQLVGLAWTARLARIEPEQIEIPGER
ncbi:MAG: hypothetical protein GEU94_07700 [Micromonosporaceae bacterium]|nr:hypothetical protein [Micromonosporaceae bacterium]